MRVIGMTMNQMDLENIIMAVAFHIKENLKEE